jgi:hypothetical protein
MKQATTRASLFTLIIAIFLQVAMRGQESNTPVSENYTRELEQRIEVLEQTVKELQQHLQESNSNSNSSSSSSMAPSQPKEQSPQVPVNLTQPSVQDPPKDRKIKVHGYTFGDYYWAAGHHAPSVEGKNGFWIRRAYLTFDKEVSRNIDTRLRFEMNSAGDFTSRGKLGSFIKDAWVRWGYAENHQAQIGISPSPSKEVVERFWGYRSLEKTLLNLHNIIRSRDFGVAFTGNLDFEKKLRYHFMLGNGSGDGSDTNEGKKVMLSLAHYPSDSFTLEFYTDFEARPGDTDRQTFQGFLGYEQHWGRLGIQYAHQTRNDTTDLGLDGLSVFGIFNLSPRTSLIARYDRMFDPNPEGNRIAFLPFDPNASSNLFLAAIDLKIHEEFSLMPNVEVVRYDKTEDGTRPGTDVIPRVTFFYRFR